ncbi:unknown [Tannerella sp. CAG:118]|nr:unknown [Tannerella sp. CAG:118]
MQIFHFVLQMNVLFLYILFSITYRQNIVFLIILYIILLNKTEKGYIEKIRFYTLQQIISRTIHLLKAYLILVYYPNKRRDSYIFFQYKFPSTSTSRIFHFWETAYNFTIYTRINSRCKIFILHKTCS